MTIASTPTTPAALSLYRESHRVVPVKDFDDDMGRFVERCDHDGLLIYPRRGGGYRHDASQIRDLAALERGEGVAW